MDADTGGDFVLHRDSYRANDLSGAGAPPDSDPLEITVIGHQWWWEFQYPELGFVTANELHVPIGRTASLTLSSADVIHSFWVPQLGGKRDLNPGARTASGSRPQRRASITDSAPSFAGPRMRTCGCVCSWMIPSRSRRGPRRCGSRLYRIRRRDDV